MSLKITNLGFQPHLSRANELNAGFQLVLSLPLEHWQSAPLPSVSAPSWDCRVASLRTFPSSAPDGSVCDVWGEGWDPSHQVDSEAGYRPQGAQVRATNSSWAAHRVECPPLNQASCLHYVYEGYLLWCRVPWLLVLRQWPQHCWGGWVSAPACCHVSLPARITSPPRLLM